ncbi:hypothetical protein SLE2022_210520 [Rubroshorea leprosula]
MNFSSFLVKSQDLGLRIFPLNPENPGSALLFSPVRRLLCGFEFLGIFRSVSFPCRCRRLLLPARSGSCWKFLVLDRSVSLVRELSARFCGVR